MSVTPVSRMHRPVTSKVTRTKTCSVSDNPHFYRGIVRNRGRVLPAVPPPLAPVGLTAAQAAALKEAR